MRKLVVSIATLVIGASACAVHQDNTPSVSGPSEAALSLKLAVNPDRIPQDGLHPVSVSVQAFDAGGHPIAVQVHLAVLPAGFGTLTTDGNGNVTTTTDASHPTVVSYLPPASTTGSATSVTIYAQSIGPDSVSRSTQQVTLIVQPAVSLASTSPVASMKLTPSSTSYATNVAITFDGTGSCATGLVDGTCPNTSSITNYTWSFGDNSSLSGSSVNHSFSSAGTYTVTLSILTDKMTMASTSQTLVVQSVSAPTAAFTVSPAAPGVGATTNFNATTSTAAAGHKLVQYDWNFGDGTSGTGVTIGHVFTTAGGWVVTLTVTDDVGQTKTTTSTVTVK